MKTAIGYVRVSTSEQADSGLGVAAQRERIEAYCKLHQLVLGHVFYDLGESGKSLDRPGVQDLLRRMQQHHVVVVAKLDRITRSIKDLGELIERFRKVGVEFASVAEQLDTTSAAGRLVVHMLGVVAQWEREVIGERTAEALRIKAARGERISRHPPYGWNYLGGKLVECPRQQAGLAEACELHERGYSLRTIRSLLKQKGLPVPSLQGLANALKRTGEINAGQSQ